MDIERFCEVLAQILSEKGVTVESNDNKKSP